MTKLVAYTYTVLRYVHDTTTGEFVNVGVALYAPEARYASAVCLGLAPAGCRSTYGRLNKMFPGINPDHFKSMMRQIQARFEELGEQLSLSAEASAKAGTELPLEPVKTVEELARRILPPDDSALQWAPIGSGRSADPPNALERLRSNGDAIRGQDGQRAAHGG